MNKRIDKQQDINTVRRRAFALAKSLGYEGEDAKLFLRQKAMVNSLSGMSLGHWLALVEMLLELKDGKPPMVTDKQWALVGRLRREFRVDDKHFRNLVKHITKLDHERFLDVASCRALIAGLIRIKEGGTPKGSPTRKRRTHAHP
jgi:hypothetical protein